MLHMPSVPSRCCWGIWPDQ